MTYRLSARVVNGDHLGRFFAKVLRPVKGIAEPEYGDFYLQWDLEADIEKKLEAGEAHSLHVAALENRNLRFLGPETVYGKQTMYKGVKSGGPEVRTLIRFCDTAAGVDRLFVTRSHWTSRALQEPKPCASSSSATPSWTIIVA